MSAPEYLVFQTQTTEGRLTISRQHLLKELGSVPRFIEAQSTWKDNENSEKKTTWSFLYSILNSPIWSLFLLSSISIGDIHSGLFIFRLYGFAYWGVDWVYWFVGRADSLFFLKTLKWQVLSLGRFVVKSSCSFFFYSNLWCAPIFLKSLVNLRTLSVFFFFRLMFYACICHKTVSILWGKMLWIQHIFFFLKRTYSFTPVPASLHLKSENKSAPVLLCIQLSSFFDLSVCVCVSMYIIMNWRREKEKKNNSQTRLF